MFTNRPNVLVATDDKRIEKAVKAFGGNVVMTSDKHNTGTNRCLEAYEIFKSTSGVDYDVVINIQGDEPLLEPEQIKQILSCFDDKSTQMATLVIPVIPFVRDADKNNWQQQHTFYKHVGMYAFTPAALEEFANLSQTSLEIAESLEQNRWLENGNKIKVATTEFETIAVDTLDDLNKVRNIITKKS